MSKEIIIRLELPDNRIEAWIGDMGYFVNEKPERDRILDAVDIMLKRKGII